MLARVVGLITTPDTAWKAIAAEGDTRGRLLGLYMPGLVLLPCAVMFLLGLLLGTEPTAEQVTYLQAGPDGGVVAIGTGTRQSFGPFWLALFMAPVSLGLAALAVFLLRDLVLQAAPRFGATADPTAATKLVVYGLTGFWLSGVLVMVPAVGLLATMVGAAHALWLLRRGAPVVLAAKPAQAGALARSVVLRAVMVGIITVAVGVVATFTLTIMLTPYLQRLLAG